MAASQTHLVTSTATSSSGLPLREAHTPGHFTYMQASLACSSLMLTHLTVIAGTMDTPGASQAWCYPSLWHLVSLTPVPPASGTQANGSSGLQSHSSCSAWTLTCSSSWHHGHTSPSDLRSHSCCWHLSLLMPVSPVAGIPGPPTCGLTCSYCHLSPHRQTHRHTEQRAPHPGRSKKEFQKVRQTALIRHRAWPDTCTDQPTIYTCLAF